MADRPAIDPIDLARALIRCPSVTPDDAGALSVLENALKPLGFVCERMVFSDENTPSITNLYARIGTGAPHFCFAGHTDVVPTGDVSGWSVDPFGAEIKDGILYGRGAADMKGSIAAFAAAASRAIARGHDKGSISLLITGDEEGPAINGTLKMLGALQEKGQVIDHCIVGEPTCVEKLGDMMKIGRRGSINGWLTVHGVQGHVAYPHLAENPIPRLLEMLRRITAEPLDQGNDFFQPTNLEITSVDVGNKTTNLIPGAASAMLNIRFNNIHSGPLLDRWLRDHFDAVITDMGGTYELTTKTSGEAFVTEPGSFSSLVRSAIEKVTGTTPELSTTGGTSDARFIRSVCPVIEFGPPNQTMHKVDEQVRVNDLVELADIYEAVLDAYFAG